jgi:hypothetical protein
MIPIQTRSRHKSCAASSRRQAARHPRSSSGEGGLLLTVCRDKAGTEESVRVAKEWLSKNAANISFDAPKVSTGIVIVHAAKH